MFFLLWICDDIELCINYCVKICFFSTNLARAQRHGKHCGRTLLFVICSSGFRTVTNKLSKGTDGMCQWRFSIQVSGCCLKRFTLTLITFCGWFPSSDDSSRSALTVHGKPVGSLSAIHRQFHVNPRAETNVDCSPSLVDRSTCFRMIYCSPWVNM